MNIIDYISKQHINYSNEIDAINKEVHSIERTLRDKDLSDEERLEYLNNVIIYRYIKLEKLKAQVILDNITDVMGLNNEQ